MVVNSTDNNEQSPLILTELSEHKTDHVWQMTLEIDQEKPLPSLYLIIRYWHGRGTKKCWG